MQKHDYFVGVLTEGERGQQEIRYVTRTDRHTWTAQWKSGEKPKVFTSRHAAEEITDGLLINGIAACVIICHHNCMLVHNPE